MVNAQESHDIKNRNQIRLLYIKSIKIQPSCSEVVLTVGKSFTACFDAGGGVLSPANTLYTQK